MLPSVRALLSGIIDFAGMFPPAQLPLEQAIRNYARYRTEPESWMLGRFVCPASRLADLSPFVDELFRDGPPLAVSALGRGGKSGSDFLADLRADLECVRAFYRRHSGRVKIDVVEGRVPSHLLLGLNSEEPSESWLYFAGRTIHELGPKKLRLFLETSPSGDWLRNTEMLVRAISHANGDLIRIRGFRGLPWGFKLRCGGTESSAFPSIGQLSFAISKWDGFGLSFKATAGLHHPLRRFDRSLGIYMHGFLNVWIACLGVSQPGELLDQAMIPVLLEDEDASNFVFDDQGVRWRDLTLSTDSILRGRAQITSFGSCSFDEPRDDLRAMGLLP